MFLLFMFLLTTNFVKNSNIYARILFILIKTVLDQLEMLLIQIFSSDEQVKNMWNQL